MVIDEFQYIGKSNPAFPSIFQRIWDEVLKDGNVMVIICGSLISMMFSQTLSYDSPLYGRRTAQIKLDQIPFEYYGEFFPDKSYMELVESYAVTGGVPKYIESFEHSSSVFEGISENILNKNSYLYNEPNFLLQQEVTEIGTYFSLIRVIAAGNHKLSAISSALGVKVTSLTKYIKVLMELDILEKRVPVTEKNPERSKKGLYFIKDNFLKFWFAFVHPNMSFLESGHREIVEEKIKRNFIDNHAAFVYEEVCRSQMWEMNANGIWPFHFTKVGSYWDNAMEIDIAACDSEHENYIFGECKYRKELMDSGVLANLEGKIGRLPKSITGKNVSMILFSISGFTPELEELAKQRDDIVLAR